MDRFCESLTFYSRRRSSVVAVGRVLIGGENPVRLQSMTNTDTNDTERSVTQIERIAAAGGEIVRLTAQGVREAENLGAIHARLRSRGYDVPLVADIHFLPGAAIVAAANVEKVRINPGNFNDKGDKFEELLDVCRRNKTALRIGVNHGSLAPAVVEKYGDTPQGMVASAMEFLRKCADANFDDVVVSMKSSNVRVMVHAYRLLVVAMAEEGMQYPLHLGVTEAGNEMEGRVKSALGIGTLLADGIGDTIRVSLTEAPENEIPVARMIVELFEQRANHQPIRSVDEGLYSPFEYRARESEEICGVGGGKIVVAGELTDMMRDRFWECDHTGASDVPQGRIVVLSTENVNVTAALRAFFLEMEALGKRNPVIIRCRYHEVESERLWVRAAVDAGVLFLDGFGDGLWIENLAHCPMQVAGVNENSDAGECSDATSACSTTACSSDTADIRITTASSSEAADCTATAKYSTTASTTASACKNEAADCISTAKCTATAIDAAQHAPTCGDSPAPRAAAASAAIAPPSNTANRPAPHISTTSSDISDQDILSLAILQAARARISRPEYIACPGCGRTLYDLEGTLKEIKERTKDMVGVKIGVMGCIVNGPGEMADADYGYVGAGAGLVTLYKGREVIKRNVVQNQAIDELIDLIKRDRL